MIIRKADKYSGLALFVFGITVWIVAGFEATGTSFMGISPAFFPRILASLICILGLMLSFNSRNIKEDKTYDFDRAALKRILVVSGVSFIYIFAFPYFGYIISTVAFMIVILRYYGVNKIYTLCISIALPVFLYIAFTRAMYMVIPVGTIVEYFLYG